MIAIIMASSVKILHQDHHHDRDDAQVPEDGAGVGGGELGGEEAAAGNAPAEGHLQVIIVIMMRMRRRRMSIITMRMRMRMGTMMRISDEALSKDQPAEEGGDAVLHQLPQQGSISI